MSPGAILQVFGSPPHWAARFPWRFRAGCVISLECFFKMCCGGVRLPLESQAAPPL